MTRRVFISMAAIAANPSSASSPRLPVPVVQVFDTRAEFTPPELHHFSTGVWAEAVRDFGRAGLDIQTRQVNAEIRRSPGGSPMFKGLDRAALNVVLTRNLPMAWDNGRGLAGLSTQYRGHHLSVIALNRAHGHQVPFFSVNTCVHELLHLLLHDVLITDESGFQHAKREFLVDWYATRLWLNQGGSAIRKAARACVDGLRPAAAARQCSPTLEFSRVGYCEADGVASSGGYRITTISL